jgi:UDP:flavonoid glycosyltransferase YjiC (YdhE family)
LRRIAVAWELGGNWGHLARELPVALALRERGYEACFAVRDAKLAEQLLGPHGFSYRQAPLPAPRAGRRAAPESYAGILWAEGYGEHAGLAAAVGDWLQWLREIEPAALVADFAPGAALAARAADLPLVTLGLGFEVPPPTEPLPSIRPWQGTSHERLAFLERTLLAVLNEVLRDMSGPPLTALHQLFPPAGIALATFPELDHHRGELRQGQFVGTMHSTPQHALKVAWADSRRPRMLAYLSPATRGLEAVLAALRATGSLIACVPARAGGAESPAVSTEVHSRPLQLDSLLPEADLLVTNGGLATSTRALLAGVPVLAVPNVVEQYLGALRIAELGAGLVAERRRTQRELQAKAEELLRPQYREHARRFASRYASETVEKAVGRVVTLIEAAVRRGLSRTPSRGPP